jgi:hypothetical protein
MASWETDCYAVPGQTIHWRFYTKVWKRISLDEDVANMIDSESVIIKPFVRSLVIASFPDGIVRGAIILVPDAGLCWWKWR